MERYVELFEKSPVEALQKGLLDAFQLEWDGKQPLWPFILEHVRNECLFDRSTHFFRGKFPEIEKAIAYVEHYRRLPRMGITPEIKERLEKCRRIVIGTEMISHDDVPRIESTEDQNGEKVTA